MTTWKKINLERVPSQSDTLTIGKCGISFSARFIRNNNLENKKSITVFNDEENEYKQGFEFFDEAESGTLRLIRNGKDTCGKTFKATEIINRSKILSKIQNENKKENRVFEIKKFEQDLYFIDMKPMFENSISIADIKYLSDDIKGIYRYLDDKDDVIYIGKGYIKNRLKSSERMDWGIRKIEYSVISDENEMFDWEAYHLNKFYEERGKKPPFNLIMGRQTKVDGD